MSNEASAYCEGWRAAMAGEDGRFTNPYGQSVCLPRSVPANDELAYAWNAGFLDAFEAEDGEEPEPDSAGFGKLEVAEK